MTTAPVGCLDGELLPCPFCGGEASLARCGFGTGRATCLDCGSEGQYRQTHAEAIAAWNTRSASRQEGWQLVPVEPTDDMLYEIQENAHILPPRGKRVWKMLLAAAPHQSQEAQGDRHG